MKLSLFFDLNKCTGCDECLRACKDEFVGNAYLPYNEAQPDTQYGYYPGITPLDGVTVPKPWVKHGQLWMQDFEVSIGKFPMVKAKYVMEPCMHCQNAPCEKAATGGAVYTRPDGIVIIDPAKAVGQRQLVASCPYGRIFWNDDLSLPQKCTMCAHRVDAGDIPRCVEACPNKAIYFGDLEDPNSEISKVMKERKAVPLHPEFGTEPLVTYAGLPMTFVVGKVIDGRTGRYIKGAKVTLVSSSGQTFTAVTDNFADFELDGLKNRQVYTVTVEAPRKLTKKMLFYLDGFKDLGQIQVF